MNRKPRLVVLPPQHLGHEIHVGRSIVIDMVIKGILDEASGDSVITGLPDRRFLYEALFGVEQVFDFSLVPKFNQPIQPPKYPSDYLSIPSSSFIEIEKFSNFQIINLSDYALPPTYCTFETSEEMSAVGYTVPDIYWNDRFIELAQYFNFLSKGQVDSIIPPQLSLFIVIHHRYSAPVEKLLLILDSLPIELSKVIFTSNSKELQIQINDRPNVYFTEDLKAYSTLLKDSRCKLLISEWSGAGQVAQYTLGPQGGVWFYYDHYPDIFNFTMTHKIWELNAKIGTYFNCWDFKNISGCTINHFSNFSQIIDNCNNIKLNYIT